MREQRSPRIHAAELHQGKFQALGRTRAGINSGQSATTISPDKMPGLRGGLPPTPPRHVDENYAMSTAAGPSAVYLDTSTARSAPRHDTLTPLLQTCPATPDVTPPRPLARPRLGHRRDLLSGTSLFSCGAESYTTAREGGKSRQSDRRWEFLSSTSIYSGAASFVTAREGVSSRTSDRSASHGHLVGGLVSTTDEADVLAHSGTSTPAATVIAERVETAFDTLRDQPNVLLAGSSTGDSPTGLQHDPLAHSARDAQDALLHSRRLTRIQQDGGAGTTAGLPPQRIRLQKQHDSPTNRMSATSSAGSANDSVYTYVMDSKVRRLSGISTQSSVIEAMVLDLPPAKLRRQVLRHVTKTNALRQGAAEHVLRLSEERRTLRHKPPLPVNLSAADLSVVACSRVDDSRPRSGADDARSRPDSSSSVQPSSVGAVQHVTIAHGGSEQRTDATVHKLRHHRRGTIHDHDRSQPIDLEMTEPHRELKLPDAGTRRAAEGSDVSDVSRGAVLLHPSPWSDADGPLEFHHLSTTPGPRLISASRALSGDDVPFRRSNHTTYVRRPPLDQTAPEVSAIRQMPRTFPSAEAPALRRTSPTLSGPELPGVRRPSWNVTPHSANTAWSGLTYGSVEIDQATAVSIYPHHNDSVVRIPAQTQCPVPPLSAPDASAERRLWTLAERARSRRTPTLEPSTDAGDVDEHMQHTTISSLSGLRIVPLPSTTAPPQLRLFPASLSDGMHRSRLGHLLRTAAHDVQYGQSRVEMSSDDDDDDRPFSMNPTPRLAPPRERVVLFAPAHSSVSNDSSFSASSSTAPRRRPSLRDRARATGTVVIDAVLRSSSLSSNGRPGTYRPPSSSSRHIGLGLLRGPSYRRRTTDVTFAPVIRPQSRPRETDAFWRPRAFWDEVPGAECDSVASTSGYAGPGARPYRHSRPVASGGFLVGNTLGIERAGSNARRHRLSLPGRWRDTRSVSGGRRGVWQMFRAGAIARPFVPRQGRWRWRGWEERERQKRRQMIGGSIGTSIYRGAQCSDR